MEKKLFLLDAYALIYRSYFAFIKNPRFNSKGLNTSAMLGFSNTLEQLLQLENPTHIAVAFDMKGPTFRHDMFKEYKANREEMPEDLRKSIPYIRDIIKAYNIPIVEKAGFEADDVIGTLAKHAEKEGYRTFMMTPDKDYAQLVSENIFMYKPKRMGNDTEIWGIPEVKENFQVEDPLQVIDILGLMGDTADNIPGCPGVGPKTAMKLIGSYGSIQGIYDNIGKLKGKQKERLVENEEQVKMSRTLAEIILDVPVDTAIDSFKRVESNKEELASIYTELEFRAQLAKLGVATSPSQQKAPEFEAGTLFGGPSVQETPQDSVIETTFNDISNTEHKYYMADTAYQRASLRADLCMLKEFCFDTETTSVDPHTAELVGMSFSWKEGEAYYVPVPANREEATAIVKEFEEILTDPNICKVGQNIKYDILVLSTYGLEVKGELFDTMIAHYLIQPELKHNLDYLCELYLKYKKVPTEQLIGKKGKKQKTMRDIPVEDVKEYACEDADFTYRLKPLLLTEMEKSGVLELFKTVEMPLVSVLIHMERNGVSLNVDALHEFAKELTVKIATLEKEIIEMAGEEFNVSSPKQLGVILFDRLLLDPKAKKTKTGQYSTGEEILQKLASKHPIINHILEYRGLKKLLSTYVEALPRLVNPKTNRIHTSFNQTVAATGRLSSNNPNLQNIPIRDENGKEIRKAFIASNEEHVYLSADYSQVELRIMAALSEDEAMIKAFSDGIDIHTATAANIYGVSNEEVTSDQRRKAKTANFGIIYGISAFGLSQRLNIPRTEAKQLIDGYFASFPGVKKFMDNAIVHAREKGYVETLLGRKRFLNDINSGNAVVRSIAERNAINAPIQGSAADIIKIAMINILRRMEEEKLQSKLILQVHDELNFDVPLNEVEKMKEIVKFEMENAFQIAVPLTVDMNTGKNWLEAH